jgi:hypothetical protein
MHGEDFSTYGRRSIRYDLHQAVQEDAELRRILDWTERIYPHMLIEDVANRIMPYRGYQNGAANVELVPHDDDAEDLIASALGDRDDLAEAFYEFGRQCLTNVVLFGEDAFEIVYGANPESPGRREFRFHRIPPRSLEHRTRSVLVQHVPRRVAKELHVPRVIHLPPDRLVVFEAPARVRKQLPQIMERLAALSESSLPSFVIENFRPGTTKVPFDVKLFSRTKDLAIAAATREIEWSGRAIYHFGEQRVVEQYWWYREFEFERFLIELRNEFLSTLNVALDRVGVHCGFVGQIRIEGVPTLNDVAEAQRHLFAGDRSLTEINAAFRRDWFEGLITAQAGSYAC